MEADVFREVSDSDALLALAHTLADDLPLSANMHNSLVVHARGHVLGQQVYVPREHPHTKLVLLLNHEVQESALVYCSRGEEDLTEALLGATTLLPWSRPFCFPALPAHLVPSVERLLQHRAPGSWMKMPMHVFVCPQPRPEVPRCEAGLRVCHLSEAGVHKMHSRWPYGYIPEDTLQRLGRGGLALGVHEDVTATDAHCPDPEHLPWAPPDSLPVVWTTVTGLGATGLLHTEETHRRKGLARLLMQVAARSQAAQGLCAICYIDEDNLPSQKLFNNLPGWQKLPQFVMYGVHFPV